MIPVIPEKFVNLSLLYTTQTNLFPRQKQFLDKRLKALNSDGLRFLESLATKILVIVGHELEKFCSDYKWFCKEISKEAMYFSKHGEYRFSKFSDVNKAFYSKTDYMEKYNNGLLISQLWWGNHSNSLSYYIDHFLPELLDNTNHLEIGPGHGIYLAYLSLLKPKIRLEAWDISSESIKKTTKCLSQLNSNSNVQLKVQDLFLSEEKTRFHSLTISEVLEHLENPDEALHKIFNLLTDKGLLFVNMPVNSPAVDHIYNLPNPEDVIMLIERNGFKVNKYKFEPATNFSLEYSRSHKLNINTLVIAEKN